MTKKNTYYTRLIKDLAETFSYTPLTVKEVAAYWKRSAADVQQVANELYKEGVVTFNKNKEILLTPNYKKFYKQNPATALTLAMVGF